MRPAQRCGGLATLLAATFAAAGCQSVGPVQAEAESPELTPVVFRPSPMPEWRPVPAPAAEAEIAEEIASPHLLARIVEGFALGEHEHTRIDQEKAWFLRNPEYLERTFRRGQPYLHHIVTSIEERGLPMELALLPLIESAYNPFAYSPGRAAGLWQFIPSTGSYYGLDQDWWYDGRRDVIESTRAALEYLAHLNELFDGDWLLTLAAYNAGQGTVRRAITRNRNAGRPTDFWSLPLPQETRTYVPRLLAISRVVHRAEALELTLPELEDAPSFAVVPVNGQMDLALAAELAGITVDDLYLLNPGFNRWATAPNGPQRLLVPIDTAEQFEDAVRNLALTDQLVWERHRISSGETLSAIAQRYGTTVDVLRQVNDISGHLIRAGDFLLVPRPGQALTAYNGSQPMGLQAQQNTPRGEVQQAASDAALSEQARLHRVHYTVRRGDSLWRIASRFAVSIQDLARWNGITTETVLQPGQELVLHVDITLQSS